MIKQVSPGKVLAAGYATFQPPEHADIGTQRHRRRHARELYARARTHAHLPLFYFSFAGGLLGWGSPATTYNTMYTGTCIGFGSAVGFFISKSLGINDGQN